MVIQVERQRLTSLAALGINPEVPRPLFYVVLAVIVVLWLQRVARLRSRSTPAPDQHMPKHLVCGACGREYDPQKSGWLCPQCHK